MIATGLSVRFMLRTELFLINDGYIQLFLKWKIGFKTNKKKSYLV